MGEITKTTGISTPALRPEPLRPTKTAQVSGVCSKTGEPIVFAIGLVSGTWELLSIERPQKASIFSFASSGKPLESFPPFQRGDNSAWCPCCHIRVRRGPFYFQCGSCTTLNCLGSHTVQNERLHVTCGQCKVASPMGEKYIESVKGTASSIPNKAPAPQTSSTPSSSTHKSAPPPNYSKMLR